MLEVKKWSTQWGGRELTIETGKLALQTSASCTVRYADTVILATVVKSKNTREGIDYFPLMVDFEEKLYAAGKIKGSRFIKREGRPTDEAILSGRVIDRAIRPLFDDTVRNDIQVVLTVLSVDGENDAGLTALVAASAALAMSDIAWAGPIAAGRIGRVDGELVLNVTREQLEKSDLDLVVAGTPDKLIMVEAGAKEVNEKDMYEAMKWGCEQLAPVVDLIKKIQKELGTEKVSSQEDLPSGDDPEGQKARDIVEKYVEEMADSMMFDSKKIGRRERNAMIEALEKGATEKLVAEEVEVEAHKAGLKNIKNYVAKIVTHRILDKDERLDKRSLTDVRELTSEVDLLPRTHGSAMFMRGDTQVLSVVTLGAPGDVQTLDTMEEDGTKRYMHHYNDAPYTYGEAAQNGSPIADKTIVLTGAMIPYKFVNSDAMFNLGSAMAFSQSLHPGVYIAINGRYFLWNNVTKNVKTGRFEQRSN